MIDFFSPGADVQSKVQRGACSQTIGMQGGTKNPTNSFCCQTQKVSPVRVPTNCIQGVCGTEVGQESSRDLRF